MALATLAGLLFVFLALEGSLRLTGWLARQRNLSRPMSDRRYTVLCVGDSFTWGIGAPADKSWPAQMQALLDAHYPGQYAVLNRGMAGANSTQALEPLQEQIDALRPNLILACTGSSNVCANQYGAPHASKSSSSAFSDALFRLRVYKLVRWLATLPSVQDARYDLLWWYRSLGGRTLPSSQRCLAEATEALYSSREREALYLARRGLRLGGNEVALHLAEAAALGQLRDRTNAWLAYQAGHQEKTVSSSDDPTVGALEDRVRFGQIDGILEHRGHENFDTRLACDMAFKHLLAMRTGRAYGYFNEKTREWVRRDLLAMNQVCRRNDIPLIFFNYPCNEVSMTLEEVARSCKRECVDIEACFRSLPNCHTYFVSDAHCNAQGYAVMARRLETTVLQALPPSPSAPRP